MIGELLPSRASESSAAVRRADWPAAANEQNAAATSAAAGTNRRIETPGPRGRQYVIFTVASTLIAHVLRFTVPVKVPLPVTWS